MMEFYLPKLIQAGNKYGLNWVYETLNDIKIHANENKINKIILVQDAAATFTNPNYDIHDLVDGVVVNPTMNTDGTMKPFLAKDMKI